jgi:hypothetical protein
LQFYPFSVKLNCTDFEVDANCGDERGGPCVIAEPEQETGFSDTCRIHQIYTYYDGDDDMMYLSLRSAAARPYGLDSAIGTRWRVTYLDEEVVMRRRHDTEPELTEKTGEKIRLGSRKKKRRKLWWGQAKRVNSGCANSVNAN